MNSESEIDFLREVWQRQPVPVVSAETELRLRQAVEEEEARAKAETGHIPWWVGALLLVPITVFFISLRIEPILWMLLAQIWALAVLAGIDQLLMKRYEREFGTSLLGRIDRACARVRLHLKWHAALTAVSMVYFSCLIFFMVGLPRRNLILSLVLVPLVVAGTAGWAHTYRIRDKLRLKQLEALRRDLAG